MLALLVLSVALAVVSAQVPVVPGVRDYRYNPNYYHDESPKPYSFNYNAVLEDGVGQSSRSETADGSGKVEGSYTVTNDEGHTRVVDYVADQYGFRANIRTNEPGTDNKNPADVVIESTAAYANAAYPYSPVLRRPVVLNPAAVQPVVAPLEPEVVPENVIQPVVRPLYRRPITYANRNVYRPPVARNPYIRY